MEAQSLKPICGAKTRAGTPCKKAPMANGRCRNHGGKSLKGAAAPSFEDGRHSKYTAGPLKERIDNARLDPNLLAMGEEIAVVDGLLADAIEKIDTGESRQIWKDLRRVDQRMRRATRIDDFEEIARASSDFSELMDRGLALRQAQEDVLTLMEQRRRLVDSERKRLVDMQQMITVEHAGVLVNSLIAAVKRHVKDQDALRGISEDLAAVIGPGGNGSNSGHLARR